jgi:hypothetical protein
MDLNKVFGVTDPGALLKGELEEAISPVTDRVDRLEKKLDLLILTINRVEALLKSMQPMVALLKKLPFLK